tara:strand:- start:5691 stop:6644 length:954 start_codon:yes stop_codon:yes gene_type:complete
MIDEIHENLIKTMDDKDLHEYYLNNGLLLNQYYKINNENKKITEIDDSNILSFFCKENNDLKQDDKTEEEINTNLHNNNLINQYLSGINDNIYNSKFKDYKNDKCKLCNSGMLFNSNNGELFCNKCGYTENIIITTEKTTYNEPPKEISYFAYKRINHFNEWIAQFQAKETTEIPQNIYSEIVNEIKKNPSAKLSDITNKQIREILKKLKYNKYYEHIPHIITIINGQKPPSLNRETEDKLRSLFKEIQMPFIKHCPENRKNFLSYAYVLHKFCELLEYDDLIDCFPLLKSRVKLQQQDKIWKCICEELKWEYIPSI